MKIINGGIAVPLGYSANGVSSGIKKSGNLDLALVYSEIPAAAAAVFTKNRFAASHILIDKANLKNNRAQAILVNSGNANCAVGKEGLSDAKRLIEALSKKLKINRCLVLIASTGIIGKRLPVDKIKHALGSLADGATKKKSDLAAKAIMTTDKKPKYIAVMLNISGKIIRIGAMAKGAGMIEPNMATLLSFITTDADVETGALKKALRIAVESSFNRISVDSDTSTNDTVIILANGLARNKKIKESNRKDFKLFLEALKLVCAYLARQIILDGEGATKFIEIKIKGARKKLDAEMIARRVGGSLLFKTAMYGEDPNWGRIIAACGASGAEVNPEKLEISLGSVAVFKGGKPFKQEPAVLKNIMSKRDIQVNIDLNQGKAQDFIWTTDLSEEYVRINAKYE